MKAIVFFIFLSIQFDRAEVYNPTFTMWDTHVTCTKKYLFQNDTLTISYKFNETDKSAERLTQIYMYLNSEYVFDLGNLVATFEYKGQKFIGTEHDFYFWIYNLKNKDDDKEE
jgi:hypothetical protein